LRYLVTEIRPSDELPADQLVKVQVGEELKTYRKMEEGKDVKEGQLLALLDDRLARAECHSKKTKVVAAEAELVASQKLREESKNRYETQLNLYKKGATPLEELRGARVTWERYCAEVISKEEAIKAAKAELKQAETILDMHEIRSAISGRVKTVHKKRGEAVKQMEPVFQIYKLDSLRVEGMVDVQYLRHLRTGMPVLIEPGQTEAPRRVLRGPRQMVTSVAVSKDPKNPLIVAASEDGTVWVWDCKSGQRRLVLPHSAAVYAVACTSPGTAANLCLTGAADGRARLWTLDGNAEEPLHELKGQHRAAITCVAFSPDGTRCVTGGGEERGEIYCWDTATGELRYRFPTGHRSAITSVQFTSLSQLVSASKDKTVRLWKLNDQGASLEKTIEGRSGQVSQVGVSPDGRRVLIEQDRELRILSLPAGLTEDILHNPSGSNPFTTLALFSLDGRLALTAGDPDGRLQLWRLATETTRSHEVRLFDPSRRSSLPSCAAFSPDGSFVVTGSRDRQVYVWEVPAKEEVERQYIARITYVEPVVESSKGQVRIWAELPNPDLRLVPGTSATMVVYPSQSVE
jgi:WD40 repeat protein